MITKLLSGSKIKLFHVGVFFPLIFKLRFYINVQLNEFLCVCIAREVPLDWYKHISSCPWPIDTSIKLTTILTYIIEDWFCSFLNFIKDGIMQYALFFVWGEFFPQHFVWDSLMLVKIVVIFFLICFVFYYVNISLLINSIRVSPQFWIWQITSLSISLGS